MNDLTPEQIELKRIRWRCRRGMRELDRLFDCYLDVRWAAACDEERGLFLRLLDCEDDKLWCWFMGYEECPDDTLVPLLERIGKLPH
jgi:antitoxin CptB